MSSGGSQLTGRRRLVGETGREGVGDRPCLPDVRSGGIDRGQNAGHSTGRGTGIRHSTLRPQAGTGTGSQHGLGDWDMVAKGRGLSGICLSTQARGLGYGSQHGLGQGTRQSTRAGGLGHGSQGPGTEWYMSLNTGQGTGIRQSTRAGLGYGSQQDCDCDTADSRDTAASRTGGCRTRRRAQAPTSMSQNSGLGSRRSFLSQVAGPFSGWAVWYFHNI